jgi:hypothetical protein
MMGFSSHQHMHAEPAFARVVLPGAPISLASSRVRTTPPPHTSEKLRSGPAGARGSAKVHSWKLVCVSVSWLLSRPRPTAPSWGGRVPREMRSAEAPPPLPAAGAPPAGPCQELGWQFAPPSG